MDQQQAADRHALMFQQVTVARRARGQRPGTLILEAAHPVFAAAVHEAPGQQIADRVEIAFQYFAKMRFDGEHGVYQRA
jgi:hypothetical protein